MSVDQDQHDKMLDRVRKLLAQAEHKNTGPVEAEAFMAKAQALIAQYGFEEDELTLNDPTRLDGQVGDRTVQCLAPFATEKVTLLAGIGQAFGVRSVQKSMWASGMPYRANRADKKIRVVHMFGTKADLDRTELLYTSLLIQQAIALKVAIREESPEWVTWHGQTAWRRSWLVGYANRIYLRLLEAEKAARADTMTKSDGTVISSALVLVSKKELVDKAVSDKYPRLTSGGSRQLSGGGYGSGDRAGRRADLGGQSRISAGARGAIG